MVAISNQTTSSHAGELKFARSYYDGGDGRFGLPGSPFRDEAGLELGKIRAKSEHPDKPPGDLKEPPVAVITSLLSASEADVSLPNTIYHLQLGVGYCSNASTHKAKSFSVAGMNLLSLVWVGDDK